MSLASCWAAVLLLGLQEKSETVAIPDTPFTFEIVRVEGGKFTSGNPGRAIEVRPFWISRHEVTWEAFEKFFSNRKAVKVDGITRPSEPYEPPNGAQGVGKHPAVSMRWHGAMAYCEWLSRVTGQRFRLPTEAEWEYAARAGRAGEKPEDAAEAAWCKENSADKTRVGGGKKANAFGLHDMLGNVWEYCLEPFQPPDFGPALRGGAWNTPAAQLSFGHRQPVHPDWYERDPNRPRSLWWLTDGAFVGFRVVRFADPAGKAAQEAYAPKVAVEGLRIVKAAGGNARAAGTVKNGGDRALDEVELTVYYLDPKGKPLQEDRKVRPTFTKAFPVLVNAWHDGPARRPLGAGESRAFEVDVPEPFDYDVELKQLGASVSALEFSK
jgi:formylglycine-generating enzyme required for sulfatase activity